MKQFGVNVANQSYQVFRLPQKARYHAPQVVNVEGDASSASYFLAAGLISGCPVRVTGLGRGAIQGDVAFAHELEKIGAAVQWGDDFIEVSRAAGQAVLPFLMGGYASNNKYSFIGGMRIVGQMLSYEAPLLFSLLGIIMLTGSLRLDDIVQMQAQNYWFIFMQPLAFIIFLIAAVAETNRTPFDLVEGESEIIAGPFTEYSGMRWALFFLAEYANLLTAAILATTFFLGGYSGPSFLPGFVWFGLKAVLMVLLIMWLRWTFPRTRVDQILTFGWKVLVPLSILNVVLTGALMFWFGIV